RAVAQRDIAVVSYLEYLTTTTRRHKEFNLSLCLRVVDVHSLRSHFWLPALLVLPLPKGHCVLIAQDASVDRIAIQRPNRAVGHIAEMAEQGALVALFNLGIQRLAGADCIEEVADMHCVRSLAGDLQQFLSLGIMDGVAIARDHQTAFIAEENDFGPFA